MMVRAMRVVLLAGMRVPAAVVRPARLARRARTSLPRTAATPVARPGDRVRRAALHHIARRCECHR